MLRKADCFNHVNEHCVSRKLGVRPKFNYTVREHVIATLLQNSIRRTLLCVALTSNSYSTWGKKCLSISLAECKLRAWGSGFISLWELSLPRGRHVD